MSLQSPTPRKSIFLALDSHGDHRSWSFTWPPVSAHAADLSMVFHGSTDKDINSALYCSMNQAHHHGSWPHHRSQTSTWPPGHGSQTPIWSPTWTSILPLVTAHTTDTPWSSEEACNTDINMAQVASQTTHVYMAISDNTGHRHQHRPWLKQDHIPHIALGGTGCVHQHDLWQKPRPLRIL